jgi:hypothetical protein
LRGPDDPDFLLGLNLSSSLNAAVERQLSFEAPYDVAEYVRIVRERIGVEGRHNAAVPKVLNGNHRVADQKVLAFPCSLFKTGDIANNNVRPKSSPVSSELRDRRRSPPAAEVRRSDPSRRHEPAAHPNLQSLERG